VPTVARASAVQRRLPGGRDLWSRALSRAGVRLRACLGAVRGRDLADVRRDLSRGRDLLDRVPLRQLSLHLRVRAVWGTYPRCGGECPAGEECSPRSGAPFDYCACAPGGVTPCGALGGFPACEQECPDAEDSCSPLLEMTGPGCTLSSYCGCVPPGPCGQQDYSLPGTCPPGLMCVAWRGYWYCSDEAPPCV